MHRRLLLQVAREVSAGFADPDLGGGVYKHRVSRPGPGKSGGFRVLLICAIGRDVFFAGAFAKSDRANIERGQLQRLRWMASIYLNAEPATLVRLVDASELERIDGH